MRNTKAAVLIGLLLVIVLAVEAAAATTNKSWLPFGGDTSKPGTSNKIINKSKKPGVVSNLSSGTKSMMTGTKNMLSPKKKKVTVRKSGTTGMQPAKVAQTEKPGMLKSLFNPEPPPPPKTIKEWMSLKKMKP